MTCFGNKVREQRKNQVSDIIFFLRQTIAKNGQIVLAQVGEKLFVRKYLFDSDKKTGYLYSYDPFVSDIYAPNFQILGVAARILKQFVNPGDNCDCENT